MKRLQNIMFKIHNKISIRFEDGVYDLEDQSNHFHVRQLMQIKYRSPVSRIQVSMNNQCKLDMCKIKNQQLKI